MTPQELFVKKIFEDEGTAVKTFVKGEFIVKEGQVDDLIRHDAGVQRCGLPWYIGPDCQDNREDKARASKCGFVHEFIVSFVLRQSELQIVHLVLFVQCREMVIAPG